EMHEAGRPVLVGTVSVEKSEKLGTLLDRRGIKHEVLNAKLHEKESGIVAQAGKSGGVTIATNMAGRGTDILLGGNPAGLASEILHRRGLNPAEVDKATYDEAFAEAKRICDEDHERVVEAGGLHIIGTERHDSRRIDNQLRGRAGRQGDPGSSRFYLSLDDDLMKRFASDRVAGMMERLGLDDETYIESSIVGRTIESAQTRVEGYNFDIRKRVVEFDDVINLQRETIYEERDKVLRNEDLTETVRAFLDEEFEELVGRHLGTANESPGDGLHELVEELRRIGIEAERVTDEELAELGSNASIVEHLKDVADDKLEAKEAEIGAEAWATVERFVLLRTIDSLWVEHLTELDDMRRGIGLRGYAQQDPLNEFRKEASGLYSELSSFIRHQVASSVFQVTVTRQPTRADGAFPMPGPGQQVGGAALPAAVAGRAATGSAGTATLSPPLAAGAAAAGGGAGGRLPGGPSILRAAGGAGVAGGGPLPGIAGQPGAQARPGHTPTGEKIGRNDACWCGSGLKYKKCHGR
ncbi:MAG TPA: SEC-C metal-binding domain-containing protein, partial [Candidatus Eisenbacteria bacterium]|nr:SEC-C metal-binding domain-containing protein [Candidatus Eisenbacteria bacterium]